MFDFVRYLKEQYKFDYNFKKLTIYGMDDDIAKIITDNGVMYPKYKDGNLSYSLTSKMFKLTYDFMQEQDKKFIYIVEETEGYWYDFNHHISIHKSCKENGISEDKIIYFNQDIHLNYRYDEWFEKQTEYQNKINMISHPFLMYSFRDNYNQLKDSYKLVRYKDRKKLPTKYFMCLMGYNNWFRANFWKYIDWSYDFKNKIYMSYIARNVLLEDSWVDNKKANVLGGESNPFIDKLESYYDDSCISIIPETSNGVYTTEKTTKVLYHGHPFIMFNPATNYTNVPKVGMLEKLREWGFETFPELFDESYDDLPILEPTNDHSEYYKDLRTDDIQIRWKAFINNFQKIIKLDIEELHKLCESVEEKCIHNRKTFFNLKVPAEQTKKKITNIVEKLS